MKRFNFNRVYIGFVSGILLPLVIFLIYLNFGQAETLRRLFIISSSDAGSNAIVDIIIKVLTLCMLPNLILLFLFLNTDKPFAARGVIMATITLAIVIAIVKATMYF